MSSLRNTFLGSLGVVYWVHPLYDTFLNETLWLTLNNWDSYHHTSDCKPKFFRFRKNWTCHKGHIDNDVAIIQGIKTSRTLIRWQFMLYCIIYPKDQRIDELKRRFWNCGYLWVMTNDFQFWYPPIVQDHVVYSLQVFWSSIQLKHSHQENIVIHSTSLHMTRQCLYELNHRLLYWARHCGLHDHLS